MKHLFVFCLLSFFALSLTTCGWNDKSVEDISDIATQNETLEPGQGALLSDFIPELPEKGTSLAKRKIPLNLPEEIAKPMWVQNALPAKKESGFIFKSFEEKPKIVVIIDDLGLNRSKSDRVAELPGPLTMAYLPYADNLPEQTEFARHQGHELMMHMPMQPLSQTADPGPNALLAVLSKEELLERLRHNLKQFDGYVGINNHMGSAFTQDQKGLRVLMQELSDRDLLYVDSRTSALSIAEQTARAYNVATTGRDVFIDHEITPEFISGALKRVEKYAREHGSAIAIGHPHKETTAALKDWLPTLKDKGFELVPITAVIRERDPRLGYNIH